MPAPVPFSFHEFDLDDARAAITKTYFPTTLDLCSARSPYEFRFDGHAHDMLTVGRGWYTSAMRVGIEEVGSIYVNFPLRGTMLAEHRHHVVDIDPSRAAVFRPTGAPGAGDRAVVRSHLRRCRLDAARGLPRRGVTPRRHRRQ
jgi:hypothetical protein